MPGMLALSTSPATASGTFLANQQKFFPWKAFPGWIAYQGEEWGKLLLRFQKDW